MDLIKFECHMNQLLKVYSTIAERHLTMDNLEDLESFYRLLLVFSDVSFSNQDTSVDEAMLADPMFFEHCFQITGA